MPYSLQASVKGSVLGILRGWVLGSPAQALVNTLSKVRSNGFKSKGEALDDIIQEIKAV